MGLQTGMGIGINHDIAGNGTGNGNYVVEMGGSVSANCISTNVLIDCVVVLCPTRHKIGHFGDVPQANLLAWYGKTKPNTTKACICQSKEMSYNTK